MKDRLNFARRWQETLLKQTEKKRRMQQIIGISLAAFLLTAGGLSFPWFWSYKLDLDEKKLEDKIAALSGVDEKVQKWNRLQAEVDSIQKVMNTGNGQRINPEGLLNRLKDHFPQGVTLLQFSYANDQSVGMTVRFPMPLDVARLWTALETEEIFEEINIQTVMLNDAEQTITLNLHLKVKTAES